MFHLQMELQAFPQRVQERSDGGRSDARQSWRPVGEAGRQAGGGMAPGAGRGAAARR